MQPSPWHPLQRHKLVGFRWKKCDIRSSSGSWGNDWWRWVSNGTPTPVSWVCNPPLHAVIHPFQHFPPFLWVHCTQSSVLVVWTDCSQFILKGHQALSAFLLEDKACVMRFKGLWKNIWHFRHDLLTDWLTMSLLACGIELTDLSANRRQVFSLVFQRALSDCLLLFYTSLVICKITQILLINWQIF